MMNLDLLVVPHSFCFLIGVLGGLAALAAVIVTVGLILFVGGYVAKD